MCTFKGSIKSDKSLIMVDFDRILIDFLEVWTCLAETKSFREIALIDRRCTVLDISKYLGMTEELCEDHWAQVHNQS